MSALASIGRVLVVEEDPSLQRFFRQVLSLEGAQVTVTAGTEEAIRQLAAGGYVDVVIVCESQGVDPDRILSAAKGAARVLISGKTGGIRAESKISKPFGLSTLLSAVRDAKAARTAQVDAG